MPFAVTSPAQPPASIPAYVIPFELRAGHVVLHATVDGRPARLILDTGSSISTLDVEWAAPLALPSVGAPVRAMGTGDATVAIATARSITIGSLELRDQRVALVPLADAGALSGKPIHGTIGRPLFARYTVEIDYARRELRLYEPASYRYDGPGVSVPLDLTRQVPLVAVTVTPRGAAAFSARLVLDLGTSGMGVIFTTPFASAHADAFATTDAIEMGSAAGVGGGGALAGRIVRLDRLDIGDLSIHEPLLALPRDGQGFFAVAWADGTIGSPIHERTTLILDYARNRAIFEAGAGMNAPFLYDASGLELVLGPPASDRIRVAAVASGSPAREGGFQPGDLVLSIDGQAATNERLDEVRESLRTPGRGGGPRGFVIERQGREMRIVLTLRTRI